MSPSPTVRHQHIVRELAGPLLRNYHEKDRLLGNHHCPVNARVQAFLDSYLKDVSASGVGLPG